MTEFQALGPQQLEELVRARLGYAPIRRAGTVAHLDAWGLAILAALTMLGGSSSMVGVLLGMAMAIIALVEFKQVPRLRRLDVDAPRKLGLNQLALGLVIVAYAGYQLYVGPDAGALHAMMSQEPELQRMMGDFTELLKVIHVTVYVSIIGVGVVVQGGMGMYHMSRAQRVRDYLERTPQWIRELQQAGMKL